MEYQNEYAADLTERGTTESVKKLCKAHATSIELRDRCWRAFELAQNQDRTSSEEFKTALGEIILSPGSSREEKNDAASVFIGWFGWSTPENVDYNIFDKALRETEYLEPPSVKTT